MNPNYNLFNTGNNQNNNNMNNQNRLNQNNTSLDGGTSGINSVINRNGNGTAFNPYLNPNAKYCPKCGKEIPYNSMDSLCSECRYKTEHAISTGEELAKVNHMKIAINFFLYTFISAVIGLFGTYFAHLGCMAYYVSFGLPQSICRYAYIFLVFVVFAIIFFAIGIYHVIRHITSK